MALLMGRKANEKDFEKRLKITDLEYRVDEKFPVGIGKMAFQEGLTQLRVSFTILRPTESEQRFFQQLFLNKQIEFKVNDFLKLKR